MNGNRDRILTRVRESLRRPAPPPDAPAAKPWFAELPGDTAGLADRFRRELETLKGECIRPRSRDQARAEIKALLERDDLRAMIAATRAVHRKLGQGAAAKPAAGLEAVSNPAVVAIAASDDPVLRDLLDGLDVSWIGPASKAGPALEPVDVGITRADALAARTGSIFLSSRTGTGRAISILPPVHVVVACTRELVPDLGDGFRLWRTKYGEDMPSHTFVITGASRTGDIEKILVLGAHGPKQLIVVLLDQADS